NEGGLLTGKYRRGSPPPKGSRSDEMPAWLAAPDGAVFDRLERIEAEAAEAGVGMAEYALGYVLARPAVASAVVGAKSRAQLDAAVEAAGSL
ncbi:MAG: aldo/keto reductase, partial [Clostridiales bacterium]|nr:aldo/keto reductase [Clostridiales bacterium]